MPRRGARLKGIGRGEKSALILHNSVQFKRFLLLILTSICYKLIQRFRVTGLFAGHYNTKLHGTITDVIYGTIKDVIYTIVGSALLRH